MDTLFRQPWGSGTLFYPMGGGIPMPHSMGRFAPQYVQQFRIQVSLKAPFRFCHLFTERQDQSNTSEQVCVCK